MTHAITGSKSLGDCHCATGYVNSSRGFCTACVQDTYFDLTAKSCSNCPAQTASPVGSIGRTSCICNSGLNLTGPAGGPCEVVVVSAQKNLTNRHRVGGTSRQGFYISSTSAVLLFTGFACLWLITMALWFEPPTMKAAEIQALGTTTQLD